MLQNRRKKMDTMPIMEDIDISISPIRITKNSPMAIIAIKDACRSTFIIFVVVRKLLLRQHRANRATNKNRIIQSLSRALKPPLYFFDFVL